MTRSPVTEVRPFHIAVDDEQSTALRTCKCCSPIDGTGDAVRFDSTGGFLGCGSETLTIQESTTAVIIVYVTAAVISLASVLFRRP